MAQVSALLLHSMLVSLCAVPGRSIMNCSSLLHYHDIYVNYRDVPLNMSWISGSRIRRTWRYVHVGSCTHLCIMDSLKRMI